MIFSAFDNRYKMFNINEFYILNNNDLKMCVKPIFSESIKYYKIWKEETSITIRFVRYQHFNYTLDTNYNMYFYLIFKCMMLQLSNWDTIFYNMNFLFEKKYNYFL